MPKTKFLVMDVDGTLTDGKIYMGQNGEIAKAFDIKDGCGILLELPQYGIIPVIITARESNILKNRCAELKISELHQGVKDKLAKLREVAEKYGETLETMAYAGDDLPDIPSMEAVKKAGGTVLCPADAIPEIRALADFVSGFKAGQGAVRDMIRFLGNHANGGGTQQRIEEAIRWVLSTDFSGMEAGTYQREDGTAYTIQAYSTKAESECVLESHRRHIDVQYMVQGREVFKTYTTACLTGGGVYDAAKDADYWTDGQLASQSILIPGSLIVVESGQPHKGAIAHGEARQVRKVVYKIEVQEQTDAG